VFIKKNLSASDVDLFYLDNYVDLKTDLTDYHWKSHHNMQEPKENKVERIKLFENFPKNKIGGVIRILFEIDSNDRSEPITKLVKGKIGINEVEQLIIEIKMKNLGTFIRDKTISDHIERIFNKKRSKQEDSKNSNKKQKIVVDNMDISN